ncbi:MAG: PIN domain protein [Spirochaetes bacterium GWF1_51_8]|nr:MAG: PIN domain protein [Spirochaetes bacterium GWF1_51_8]
MKRIKVYLDTSVIGGCFDKEFEIYSNKLFDSIRNKYLQAVISDITISELERAPDYISEVLLSLSPDSVEIVNTDSEIIELAEKYLREGIVSENYKSDALHIAIATVYRIDVLVSWNFRHIVNLQKIKLFNSVNLKEGYQVLDIRTPLEVIENGK